MDAIAKLKNAAEAIREWRKLQHDAEAAFLHRFGARLKELRDAANMTQQELADMAGLSRASIANMEAGNQDTTIGTLVRVAVALGREPRDLIPDSACDASVQGGEQKGAATA